MGKKREDETRWRHYLRLAAGALYQGGVRTVGQEIDRHMGKALEEIGASDRLMYEGGLAEAAQKDLHGKPANCHMRRCAREVLDMYLTHTTLYIALVAWGYEELGYAGARSILAGTGAALSDSSYVDWIAGYARDVIDAAAEETKEEKEEAR